MKSSEYLRKAKALIDSPEKWTKYAFARDIDGIPVGDSSHPPVCYCSLGAIAKATKDSPHRINLSRFLRIALLEKGFTSLSF